MSKKILFYLISFWLITIIVSIIWGFENPEKIERVKSYFKKKQITEVSEANEDSKEIIANSFNLNVKKVLEIEGKTAFISHDLSKKFNIRNLNVFTQTGNLIENLEAKKVKLPKNFTLQMNGGIKTIITLKENEIKHRIALISSYEKKDKHCFFASLVLIKSGNELFRSKCLPADPNDNDFNGLGSSNIHLNDKILFTLGSPEKHTGRNGLLAQKDDSKFGKILEIEKSDLIKKINDQNHELNLKIYSKGHRVPQGLTLLDNKIFSVEHGPKGGDELNLIGNGKNYGWPDVSYGTNYLVSEGGDGASIKINHEKNNFEEPLFAFVPSVGISSLNNCPSVLKNYYKKNCLMALSLYGNSLRKGYSMIIFLINDDLTKVNSIEKIQIDTLPLRHFVTDDKNRIYEDEKGNIYISADKKGIYKINFNSFR